MSAENERIKLEAKQRWVGQSFKQNNGYIATVIDYENSKNVTIQFNDEEKTIRTGIRPALVKKGIVGLKPTVLSVKIGERYLQNCGNLNIHNQTRNFYGFKTFGVPQIMGEDTFYKAVFMETGEEFCMTPYMMMEYYKENQKNK